MPDGYLYLDPDGNLKSQSETLYDDLPAGWTRLALSATDYDALVAGLKVWNDGALVDSPRLVEEANQATIQTQAEAALQANRDFLAIAAPTQAQVRDQVRALTRQNIGLIRLALGRFDGAG